MPDVVDGGVADDGKVAATSELDSIKEVVGAFKESLAAIREQQPVVAPIQPQRTDFNASYAKIQEEVDRLNSEGKAAEAMTKYALWLREQEAAASTPYHDTPHYKNALENTKREMKREHKDVFDRWGKEVTAIVDSLPPERRLLHTEWDDAVARVRGAHFTEISQEQEKAVRARIEEEYKQKGFAPQAPGSRGGAGRASDDELNPYDAGYVSHLGVSVEDIKKHRKVAEEHFIGEDVKSLPLLDEKLPRNSAGRSVVKRGEF